MTDGLFCDGGVIRLNPSPFGGTWAWTLVSNNLMVQKGSGLLLPKMLNSETISNNVTELYAALRALEAMDSEWRGTLYTDSMVTLQRLKGRGTQDGLPIMMKQWLEETLAKGPIEVELVSGHPTKLELLRGRSRGRKVSLFNVWCDKRCTKLARQWSKANDRRPSQTK